MPARQGGARRGAEGGAPECPIFRVIFPPAANSILSLPGSLLATARQSARQPGGA